MMPNAISALHRNPKEAAPLELAPKDILAALAPFKTVNGLEPLKLGYIQDIAIEPHADRLCVNMHVDDA